MSFSPRCRRHPLTVGPSGKFHDFGVRGEAEWVADYAFAERLTTLWRGGRF